MNIEIDFDEVGKKIGQGRIIYFLKLLKTISKTNEVDLSVLDLPKGTFNTIRHKFIKEGIIKKCKLQNDTVKKYYFNPIYGTIVKDIDLQLYDEFNKINNNKIY